MGREGEEQQQGRQGDDKGRRGRGRGDSKGETENGNILGTVFRPVYPQH